MNGDFALAVGKQNQTEHPKEFQHVGLVTCDNCGAQFSIRCHPALIRNDDKAEEQAKLLEKLLLQDHSKSQPHRDLYALDPS